jgi:membrane-associated phospholipid phosphatase
MRRAVVLAVAALFAAPVAQGAKPNLAHSNAVQSWVEVTLEEIAAHKTNPPRASRVLAHMSAAVYAAAVLGGNDRDDVIDGAAAAVLSYLYPDRATYFDSLAGSGAPQTRGRALGAAFVERARHDGADAVWDGTRPTGPGTWVPTPPAFAPPLEPMGGTWRTWNLVSGAQFRPGPPPAFGSAAWRAELQQVYDVSRSLTPEQTAIALYWADGAGTVTPPGHWDAIALELAAGENLSTVQLARLFVTLNTAQADAFIACWDAKFTYWPERPATAIQAEIDPFWTPLIPTPPFPSYVSGHSTTSGAAATVLGHFFPQRRDELAAMADEAALSRLYGGIHFASDNAAGLELGRKVGREALRGNAGALLPAA